jgi:hypothetical protein
LRPGWGVNRRHGRKSEFQHGVKRFGKKSKLQQSGNERGKKAYVSMAGLGQKKEETKVQKNVIKLSKSSKNCQKTVKHFCTKLTKKKKHFFLKMDYDF